MANVGQANQNQIQVTILQQRFEPVINANPASQFAADALPGVLTECRNRRDYHTTIQAEGR